MSEGTRIPLLRAQVAATAVLEALAPVCRRVAVAGSVRRLKPYVGDVEIVAEPEREEDLFGGGEGSPILKPIRAVLASFSTGPHGGGTRKLKGHNVCGTGVPVELYLVHPPAAFGSLLTIRTGPRDFSQWCMNRLRWRGYRQRNGYVVHKSNGARAPADTEAEFFALMGLPVLAPEKRGQVVWDRIPLNTDRIGPE